ncbi:3-hydroxybutyrate dehydrogenase [Rhodococcus ruber]|uniref:3-hydroxybutyrate dehydrogenase n=1 Tax=Rhodococcus ruber TaxID=1830 RepID=UPI00265DD617|nr:3-hydroxybutyrate dehydrogenase [Rhodococcus ruber]MDO1481865.1 3-hydroxybutyrate dehydrogenase [Rhodococcus ruber]
MESVNGSLNGRLALVTGAASGVGRAIASSLAGRGASILAVDFDGDRTRTLTRTIGGESLVADLSNPAAVESMELECRPIDILVNCAGVQHVAPIEDFDPTRFEQIYRLMLLAPFLLTQAVLPGMYERGWGRLIHVSSVHGHRASAYKSAYVSAKHGLEGLSKVIAVEGANRGVTSNTVSPGYVRTPLIDGQIADQARRHGIREEEVVRDVLLSRTPLKRLIEPEEVGNLVAFLCGPGTDLITGSSYIIDGGWSAT